MKINLSKLRIGDQLIRTKGGSIKHYAVLAGVDKNGKYIVAENQINRGVQYIYLDKFLSEGNLVEVQYNNYSVNEQVRIQNDIKGLLGTSYDLLAYNCEHFVNHVLTHKPVSYQVRTFGVVAVLCLGHL